MLKEPDSFDPSDPAARVLFSSWERQEIDGLAQGIALMDLLRSMKIPYSISRQAIHLGYPPELAGASDSSDTLCISVDSTLQSIRYELKGKSTYLPGDLYARDKSRVFSLFYSHILMQISASLEADDLLDETSDESVGNAWAFSLSLDGHDGSCLVALPESEFATQARQLGDYWVIGLFFKPKKRGIGINSQGIEVYQEEGEVGFLTDPGGFFHGS